MQAITTKERKAVLIMRVRRLLFVAEMFGGPDETIENNSYLILETQASRPRAICRYIRFALREWRQKLFFRLKFRSLLFWYRRVKGLGLGAAVNQAHKRIEDRIFMSKKGENNGQRH